MTQKEIKNLKIGDVVYWKQQPECVMEITQLSLNWCAPQYKSRYISPTHLCLNNSADIWFPADQLENVELLTPEKKLELL